MPSVETVPLSLQVKGHNKKKTVQGFADRRKANKIILVNQYISIKFWSNLTKRFNS